MHERLALLRLLLLVPTAAQADCPSAFTPANLKVVRPTMPPLPQRDRYPYPQAKVRVTCKIKADGHLSACSSDLDDERGPAFAAYVAHWQVSAPRQRRCPVRGRQFIAKFRLWNGD